MSLFENVLAEIEALDLPEKERIATIKRLSNSLQEQVVRQTETSTNLFRHVLTVEVLTDRDTDLDNWSLAEIEEEFTDGGFSGSWEVISKTEVSHADMICLVQNQGSDPEFFGPTEDHEDEDE